MILIQILIFNRISIFTKTLRSDTKLCFFSNEFINFYRLYEFFQLFFVFKNTVFETQKLKCQFRCGISLQKHI